MTSASSSSGTNTCPDSLPDLRREVQCKLGRCMIKLQQYERMLKAMTAGMALEGPADQLQEIREKQEASTSTKTLGGLVRMFTDGHLKCASSDDEDDAKDDVPAPDALWVRMSFSVSMSPENLAQTKAGLTALVAMRNELVHHFIERFDLSGEHGCRAASIHLDDCYTQIDHHYGFMRALVVNLNQAQEFLAQSPAFHDALVHGIYPDGSVCWPHSTIVECLRDAETACQNASWTDLHAAIAFIGKHHPDQIPSRYGCKTWRQVLKRSELFELRSSPGSEGVASMAWYRSLPEGAPNRP